MSPIDAAGSPKRPLLGQYCQLDSPDAKVRMAAMTAMVSTLVHEVCEPLTAATNYIHTCARLLRDRGEASEDIIAILDFAGRETVKSGEIMRRMRNFIVSGKIVGKRENLRDMIGKIEAVKAFEYGAQVRIEVTVPDEGDHVMADRLLIEQVLSIILKYDCEALKTRTRPRITISARRDGDEVVVRILDNGKGLSDQERARLFEPMLFFEESGTDIGLPICKAIVEAHGGRLWVEGTPNGSTAFNLTLHAAD